MSNNKYNAPYYISGSVATLALLASGVLAVAPYVQFLAPIATSIAVLNLTLPVIAFCAVFSLLAITLSYKAVSKNKAIAEQETQLAEKVKEIEAKNKTLSEKEAQLAEKAKEVKDKDVVISYVDEQLAGKDVVISEMKDQLAKKARKIEAKNKFIINSDIDSQQIHQKRRAKKQTNAVEEDGDMYFESLFENISAESEPDVRPVEAPKQIGSGWFSPRQVLGIGIGAMFGFAALLAQYFIGPTALSLTNSSISNVKDHNNPVSPSANPVDPRLILENKLDQAHDMFKTSQERAKQNFGVKNLRKDFLVSDTVEQNISTSVYSVVKDKFFGLFKGKGTTSNVVLVEGSIQVGQNDPAKGCTIVNKYINQTDESACSYDDYPVPLPNLKHVALCCPTMPKTAHL